MINPLDMLARAAAIPSIVWSASNVLLGMRRRFLDDAAFASRLSDGFFERVEEQCRTRWADLFGSDDSGEADRAA